MATREKALLSKKDYKNILNYVYDNKDVTFEQRPFSLLDSLVFACIAYIPFEEFEKTNKNYKPKNISKLMFEYLSWLTVDKLDIDFPGWMRNTLFLAMSLLDTKRFEKVKISRFSYQFDENEESLTQFGAFVFTLPDDTYVVSYRGTDNSILGWKEDFAMAVSETVTGQALANDFMQETISLYKGKRFYITGHSKGANFAVYAGSHLSKEQSENLINIYSFDGPGLSEKEFKSEGHCRVFNRIVHVVPKDDAIGTLLFHEIPSIIVEAGSKKDEGDFTQQHDAYTWKIENNDFVRAKSLSNSSKYVTKSMNEWIDAMPLDKRAELVSTLFEIIKKTGAEKANAIYEHPATFLPKFIYFSRTIDKKGKKNFREAFTELIAIFTKNVPIYFKKKKKTTISLATVRKIKKSEA